MDLKNIKNIDDIIVMFPCRPLRKILFITYTSSQDAEILLPCTISEERYKISEGYKLTLVPIYSGFQKHDIYQCDLESLLKDNTRGISLYVKQDFKI